MSHVVINGKRVPSSGNNKLKNLEGRVCLVCLRKSKVVYGTGIQQARGEMIRGELRDEVYGNTFPGMLQKDYSHCFKKV